MWYETIIDRGLVPESVLRLFVRLGLKKYEARVLELSEDELCQVRESFKLTKAAPPQEMLLKMHKRLSVKQFTPFLAKDIIFGEKEKKCPFRWFRK